MKDIGIQSNLKTGIWAISDDKKTAELGSETFEETLTDSIKKVNFLQNEADQAIQELMVGKNKDVHETMVALGKADVSFQMMMKVRNKIVEAYQEIMRTQI